jgi:hypothetical protein
MLTSVMAAKGGTLSPDNEEAKRIYLKFARSVYAR